MDGAALLLLAAGVGVGFGWQPMPDGSDRYEYIVQLEPELAQRLADGMSAPIASEVPADIRPIGRVSVVVGDAPPPRQRLVTRLKPATDVPVLRTAGDSVQLAQYNQQGQPADPRYAVLPQQDVPGGQVSAASAEPGSGDPRQTSQPWNAPAAAGPVTPTPGNPPTPQQLFGDASSTPGAVWNGPPSAANAAPITAAAGDAVTHMGQAVGQAAQQAGQQLADGLGAEAGAAVRQTADAIGNRTQGLINELRQSIGQPLQAPLSQSAGGTTAGSTWNTDPQTAAGPPLAQGADSAASSVWNNPPQNGLPSPGGGASGPTTPPTGPGAGGGPPSAAWPGNYASPPDARRTPAPPMANQGWDAPAGAGRQQPGAGQLPSDDPWRNVADDRLRSGGGAPSGPPGPSVADLTGRPAPFGGNNADWNTPAAGPQPVDAVATPSSQPAPAAIARDMLNQPADRPLEGAPVAVASQPPKASQDSPPPAWPSLSGSPAPQSGSQPAGPDLASVESRAPSTASTPSTAPRRDNAALVLAAWVLLSGSVAGNFYLFWSYLDVRQKYRSLVRKTARAVGRFSAA